MTSKWVNRPRSQPTRPTQPFILSGRYVTSKLQLDVCFNNEWWRHLVNAYEIETGMVLLAGIKLCDSCLNALRPVYSDTTQLNSTQVLRCVAINGRLRPELSSVELCRYKWVLTSNKAAKLQTSFKHRRPKTIPHSV